MPYVIQNHFDSLHFTESVLGEPLVQEGSLTIPVAGLFPLHGHPLVNACEPLRGKLVFKGVASSRRKVIEYIGDSGRPQGYRAPYFVEDVRHCQPAAASSSPGHKVRLVVRALACSPSERARTLSIRAIFSDSVPYSCWLN